MGGVLGTEADTFIQDNRPQAERQRAQQLTIQRYLDAGQQQQAAPLLVAASASPVVLQRRSKSELETDVEGWQSEVAKTLMAGVLDAGNPSDAAAQVYSNLFAYASNWQYRAGHGSSN